MMELLLKEIRADKEEIRTNQAKMEANRKTDKEEMLARMDANMKSYQKKAKLDRKTGQEQLQENLKRIIEEMMLIN